MASIRQAFVLAAGLGTRLRPLTDELPKPLVPILQKPLITFAFDHLVDIGVETFVVNTHRLPEAFSAGFPESSYRSHRLEFVNEPILLDTGGGIKNVEGLLGDEPFITYSGDVLSDLPLQPLIEEHLARANDVTLALRNTGLGLAVALDENRIVDIAKKYGIPGNYDFANIAVWSRNVFARLPPGQKVSFIPILADWIRQGGKIGGLVLNQGRWFNLGSRAEYFEVHRTICGGWRPNYLKESDWISPIHRNAAVDPSAEVRGCTVIGANCRVGAGAILEDTIVWPDSQIASRSELVRCIVRSHKNVSGIHRDIDI